MRLPAKVSPPFLWSHPPSPWTDLCPLCHRWTGQVTAVVPPQEERGRAGHTTSMWKHHSTKEYHFIILTKRSGLVLSHAHSLQLGLALVMTTPFPPGRGASLLSPHQIPSLYTLPPAPLTPSSSDRPPPTPSPFLTQDIPVPPRLQESWKEVAGHPLVSMAAAKRAGKGWGTNRLPTQDAV